ncbi:MAG: GDSL-type esterase/lipase family protein, partial [Mesotoga sp.]|uniref:SGNH/GDSL hydrolase family protein n=1 Tax=Mesotoga sp. TaxID=2053577 RepID=UPI0026393ACA
MKDYNGYELKMRRLHMNTVVCIGDSITYGRVGASYFEMLKSKFGGKFKFINSGINGNLSYDVLKRIDKVTNMKPDIAILLVGTNDVWATYSEKTMKAYIRKNKLPERPSKESYARNFTEILKRLKTASIEHIGVMSLPLITEDPEHILFKRSAEYSELIKKITSQMDLCYIDLNERQRDYLTKNKKNPSSGREVSWEFTLRMIFKHIILRKSWDALSQENGFLLTVDHVHQNSTGAALIKDCSSEFLKKL